MISDLDIYRAANLVINRHGRDAVIEAARMIDRMLELGDVEGGDLWRRIRRAVGIVEASRRSSWLIITVWTSASEMPVQRVPCSQATPESMLRDSGGQALRPRSFEPSRFAFPSVPRC